jgi:hypothetical protein
MGKILPRILPILAVLLLSSAPALSQFAGPTLAQPSPPPSQKKAPVAQRAMKTCQEYGAGYVWVEGTGSCVKIGGYVRAQGTR